MWPFSRKRIAAAPERKGMSGFWGVGAARFMNHRYESFANEGYGLNPVAHACIDLLASSIASVSLQVFQKKGGKLDKLDNHPLLDLLANPNAQQSSREFISSLVSFYLIGGNTYVLGSGIDQNQRKNKPPLELHLLRPEATTVRTEGSTVFPQQYEYRQAGGGMVTYPVNQINGFSAVMHLKTFNPLDQWRGLSPMVAAAYGIDTFNSGMRWNKALLDNDARPAGMLTVTDGDGKPVNLSDEQRQRLREELERVYSGAANAGKPMVGEGGLDWKPMSMSMKDMDHREGMLTMARFVAGVYHVPPQLVNIPGESTYNNYAQAKLAFWSDTVLPLLGMILDGFNRWLTPLYGPDLYLEYDPNDIAALEPMRKDKAARVNSEKWLTINEQRRAMGRDDLPKKIGEAIMISGRGVLLGLDGEIVSFEGGPPTAGIPGAPGSPPTVADTAKSREGFRTLLVKSGYSEARINRLLKVINA